MTRYAIQNWSDALGRHYRLLGRETGRIAPGLYGYSALGGVDPSIATPDDLIRAVVEVKTTHPIAWPGFEPAEPQLASPRELLFFVSRIDESLIEYERIDPP